MYKFHCFWVFTSAHIWCLFTSTAEESLLTLTPSYTVYQENRPTFKLKSSLQTLLSLSIFQLSILPIGSSWSYRTDDRCALRTAGKNQVDSPLHSDKHNQSFSDDISTNIFSLSYFGYCIFLILYGDNLVTLYFPVGDQFTNCKHD